jgi:hypothetical protein
MALHYPADEWKRTLKKQPFVQLLSKVEQERCTADLMYTILMHPDQVLGATTTTTVIERLVNAGFDIITKKYAPDLSQSRMIREARAYVTNSRLADTYVQRFVFLFMLHKEEELQQLIESAYVEGKHMWGTNEEARQHFRLFLTHLGAMVQSTLDWPCSELNMVDVVRNLVRGATKCYLMTGLY